MIAGVDARELYEALVRHEGAEAYETVVVPWLNRAGGAYRAQLASAAECTSWWAGKEAALDGQELRWELYALSRVSDLLLLDFQPPADEADSSDSWLGLSEQEYLGLFTSLGMTPLEGGTFDPFLHEIVEVSQADDPHAPTEFSEFVWPGLMLGQLLFSRAGVRVRAGLVHAQRGVADRSPLYWTFRRRHRPTVDLSQGWGHNSQWRTDFRLDYRTPTADLLNVAGSRGIDGSTDLSPEERLLTPGERRELLRHRCLLRVPEAVDALAPSHGWERDLWPFDWRLPDPER